MVNIILNKVFILYSINPSKNNIKKNENTGTENPISTNLDGLYGFASRRNVFMIIARKKSIVR
jgi:hypothetical protein